MEISVSTGSLVIEYLVLNRFYIQREGKPNIYMFFINTITWQTTICIFFLKNLHMDKYFLAIILHHVLSP
ncbi:hypothetical protein XF28_22160 [Escherichia coli]|nr:hypothetical protein XF28_22160 [Escherichia coli]